MKICAIIDIDNVYVDSRKWNEKLPTTNDRAKWDEWHANKELSKPNRPIIKLTKALHKFMPIFFVTGREDRNGLKEFTIKQIEKYSHDTIKIGERNKLFMRKENDFRPSAEVKEEILKKEILGKGYQPIIAIDDNKENAEMFRKNGITTRLYTIG